MAVSTTFGLPRMGPTFSSMLFSGSKVGTLTLENFEEKEYALQQQ